jgi:hypothetical protein
MARCRMSRARRRTNILQRQAPFAPRLPANPSCTPAPRPRLVAHGAPLSLLLWVVTTTRSAMVRRLLKLHQPCSYTGIEYRSLETAGGARWSGRWGSNGGCGL